VKLLFDQNISFRVVKKIHTLFPGSKQLREAKLENATDQQVWNYAKKEKFSIVTFDGDFYDLVTLYGHPPKIIWLRMGNISTDNIANTFAKHIGLINAFLTDDIYFDIGCLEIDG
jgi:predicted nuclease of predicted toxin-antitoxin system